MAEEDPLVFLSAEDRAMVLRIQAGDDETDEERQKRKDFQRQAEELNLLFLTGQIEAKETDDAVLARAYQANRFLPVNDPLL